MREQAIIFSCAFTCLLLLVCSKGANNKTAMRSEGEQPSLRKKISESPETGRFSQFGPIQSDPEASETWLRFTANGRYRMANADDFQLSHMTEKQYQRSYGTGDFNRDGYYSDFAVIVVDTTRNDAFRFSLIIFNRRKQGTGYDGPFWLFRDADLSGASLSTSSHGPLLVAKQSEGGAAKVCIVEWNEELEVYACDEEGSIQ